MGTLNREILTRTSIPVVGTLASPEDIQIAVEHLSKGNPVAFQYRRVFGLAIDCSNTSAIRKVLRIKGDPDPNRPFSGMIRTEVFIDYVDKYKIHPSLIPHFSDASRFQNEISTLFHVRAPIKQSAVLQLPRSMVSQENGNYYIHNLDSHGHPINGLTEAAYSAGITNFGVTTANRAHIQPETTNLTDALDFLTACDQDNDVGLVLSDPTPTHPGVLGSWGIIDITYRPDGKLTAIRHGHVPFNIIEQVIGLEIDTTNAKPAAYPQADFCQINPEKSTSKELRTLVLGFIHQS